MRSALQALGIFFRSQADYVAAMVRKSRAWREDDAMARLDEGTLRDIGIDRCQIRHVAPLECATDEGTADGSLRQ